MDMATAKEVGDKWIDYVYDHWIVNWLRNDSKLSMRDSTKNMVRRMIEASSDSSRAEDAWNLLERLKRLSDGLNNGGVVNEHMYEKFDIYIECALVAYKLGDLQEALNLLRIPTETVLKRSLHKSISYWLCGCIQWQLPSHLEDAVLSWERGMQTINEVEKDRSNTDLATAKKCKEISGIMRDAINKATLSNIPPYPPAPGVRRSLVSSFNLNAYEAKLKFISFFGSIPAGNSARAFDYPIGSAGVEELELETDRFYKIFNVKQEKEIRLNISSEYFILKVSGDSMNIAEPVSIDSGDYVLLIKTMIPQDNDIVAGVIVKEDETATLKRYRIENSRKFLVSESNISDIRILMSDEDYVQGVVLAILKPKDE
jgi:hypothetical protein